MLYLGLTNVLFILRYALARMQVLRRQFYYILLLALFIFSAFRYEVGCDWSGYYNQYLRASSVTWDSLLQIREPIWWGVLAWIKGAGLPYPVANIVSSAVFFMGVHVFARRQPDPLGFLILLFPILIINMPMSAIRQGAAIGLICIAFTAFIDRRPIRFIFWTLLSSGFHASALIFLLLLPLSTGRYSNIRLFMAAILALPGALLIGISALGEVAGSRYIGSDVEAAGAVFRVSVLGLSSLYFFVFIRKKWMLSFPEDYSIASIGAIGMILVLFLVPLSSVIGDRLGYYLIPLQAMIFARIPFLPFNFCKSLHSAIPYLGLFLVFFIWTQLSEHFQRCYIPYDSWILGLPEEGAWR